MEEKTFYDIHLHAFNLSHPYLRAFIRRYKVRDLIVYLFLLGGVAPLFRKLIEKKYASAMNLLAVMEEDTDRIFLLLENCLREDGLLTNDGLRIGKTVYKKVILTPLMMDFGQKSMPNDLDIHYNKPNRKPIRKQVGDVFSAIASYHAFEWDKKYKARLPHLETVGKQATKRMFEIYPFIGVNPQNYTYGELVELMEKYFGEYAGERAKLFENNPKYTGHVADIESNYAAGVKLYPPLGFDPWPETSEARTDKEREDKPKEQKKVDYLYDYCEKKCIPITVHASAGGFNVLDKDRLKVYADIDKWGKVLDKYPRLKLNLAHFPLDDKKWIFFRDKSRLNKILGLLENENYKYLYVDFSMRATKSKYYEDLKKVIDDYARDGKVYIKERIMFGTDFSVNLMTTESYNSYYELFRDDPSIKEDEKDLFCSVNPERFLFGSNKVED